MYMTNVDLRRMRTVIKEYLVILSHILKGLFYTHTWYKRRTLTYNPTAVAVIDGKLYSGGMTDRFIGIISLYAWCKKNHRSFRIQYTSPFNLSDYLQPALYNWIPNEQDYVRSSKTSFVVYGVGEKHVDKRLNRIDSKKQIHYYGNRDFLQNPDFTNYDWGCLFKELFKPSENLKKHIDLIKENLPSTYFSIVFRFQNLLDDFQEYNFKSLATTEEKERLISQCLQSITELAFKEKGMDCLVTSDSITFLKRAKMIHNVHVIPGSLIHMGSDSNGTYEQYEKSFLDFFMLSQSIKIYNVVLGRMYSSGFPKYAAKINNIPFERIIKFEL